MNSELIRAILPLVSAVWLASGDGESFSLSSSLLSFFLSSLNDRDSFPWSFSGATGAHPAQRSPLARSPDVILH